LTYSFEPDVVRAFAPCCNEWTINLWMIELFA
jgi:hypothetical protein